MKILRNTSSGNYIATIAIGKKYLNQWRKFSYPSWIKYCKKYNLGLIVFDEDLNKVKDQFWKKATWQKFLIGKEIKESKINVKNICYLDTDIIINFLGAPNIFDFYKKDTFGLISMIKNLPMPREYTLKSMAFNRNFFYSKKYPLDSALFMSPEQQFEYHGLKKFSNFACAGVFLFNIKNHSDLMYRWYRKYPSNYHTITLGDQPILNYEILNHGKITWLDYKFQALWSYEMAWKYPFLYDTKNAKKKEILNCIEASLMSNYFLHFPGAWNEGKMWMSEQILSDKQKLKRFTSFAKYLIKEVSGRPKGIIKPKLK